jgi:hypothetical protein
MANFRISAAETSVSMNTTIVSTCLHNEVGFSFCLTISKLFCIFHTNSGMKVAHNEAFPVVT